VKYSFTDGVGSEDVHDDDDDEDNWVNVNREVVGGFLECFTQKHFLGPDKRKDICCERAEWRPPLWTCTSRHLATTPLEPKRKQLVNLKLALERFWGIERIFQHSTNISSAAKQNRQNAHNGAAQLLREQKIGHSFSGIGPRWNWKKAKCWVHGEHNEGTN
jgi:hypothetical protein